MKFRKILLAILVVMVAIIVMGYGCNDAKAEDSVYISVYNLPSDGTTDCIPAFNTAISEANTRGGAKIIVPYNSNGYSISAQLLLSKNTELDLQGSTLKPIGSLNVYNGDSLVKVNYSGNAVKNICFSVNTGQYGIEFGSTSKNNLEQGCTTSIGYNQLIKTEFDNPTPYSNQSLSLESITKGRVSNLKPNKVEYTVQIGASEYLYNIQLRDFPSSCDISRFKVTDEGGSPDFATEILYNSSPAQYFYVRARELVDVDAKDLNEYYKIQRDDILRMGIYNFKASATTFKVEVWFTNETYTNKNKVWQYSSKEDFIRPHADNTGSNNGYVNLNSIQQMEYRFRDSNNNLKIIGSTPGRNTDAGYQYPNVIVPSPAGVMQQSPSQCSEIKFYLNYPASRAVIEKPTNLVFNVHKVPKETKARLIVGWYSQNPDNQPMYLDSAPIVEKDIIIPATASNEEPYVINIPLDPKGYQKGSTLETDKSVNFLYFVLWQKDETYTPYLFGEEYVFNTYIY